MCLVQGDYGSESMTINVQGIYLATRAAKKVKIKMLNW